MNKLFSKLPALLCALVLFILATPAFGANVVIESADAANVGFNDPTPVSPVGGNTGTTLGQQRLIALQYAGSIWGATLGGPTITIRATWEAQPCAATSGTLASAGNFGGAGGIWRDFPGAPVPATWFGNALANALSGVDQNGGSPEIAARFNINLGNTGCLEGAHWYYGLGHSSARKRYQPGERRAARACAWTRIPDFHQLEHGFANGRLPVRL
jgi:hypothetical protein